MVPVGFSPSVLVRSALEAAVEYYQRSGGVHIGDDATERLIQVRLYEAIWGQFCTRDGTRIFCRMETGPRTVCESAGIKDTNSFLGKLTKIGTASRFDLVFYEGSKPRGIIEVKVGRNTVGLCDDLLRIVEFGKAVNGTVGDAIEIVGALFVERNVAESEIKAHRDHIERDTPGIEINWETLGTPYEDFHRRGAHSVSACIAVVDMGQFSLGPFGSLATSSAL
jgi:hypothetical protein